MVVDQSTHFYFILNKLIENIRNLLNDQLSRLNLCKDDFDEFISNLSSSIQKAF